MNKTLQLFAAGLLLFTGSAFSQNPFTPEPWKDNHPNTPEAAKMKTYIDAPISYTRGMLDISIPLYEITVGELKIPITLSYNHKGIKSTETTLILGLGWSLQAEPQISRSPSGQPDINMRYSPEVGIPANYNDQSWYHNKYTNRYGNSDGRPDQYFYSLLGKSGSFYLKNTVDANNHTTTFEAVTLPYDPTVKIEPAIVNNKERFTITGDDGAYYIFGLDDKFNTVRSKGTTQLSYTSAWKANMVVSPNRKDTIHFKYDDEITEDTLLPSDFFSFAQVSEYDFPDSIYIGTFREIRASNNVSYGIHRFEVWDDNPSKEVFNLKLRSIGSWGGGTHAKNENLKKLLTSIMHKHGEVNFEYDMAHSLQKINIKDQNGKITRSISFYHKRPTYPTQSEMYVMLDSILIKDSYGATIDSYKMEYHKLNNNSHPKIIGNELSVNFWGYLAPVSRMTGYYPMLNQIPLPIEGRFTGVGEPIIKIPGHDMEMGASPVGILKSLTNSMGGVTSFEYENDTRLKRYNEKNAANEIVERQIKIRTGALRISSVIYTDPLSGESIKRKICYGHPSSEQMFSEDGLGVVRREITPEAYSHEQIYEDAFGNQVITHEKWVDGKMQQFRRFSPSWIKMTTYSSSLNGDFTISGDPVVYDRVTEYRITEKNGVEVTNGKTVYYYDYPLNSDRRWDSSAAVEEVKINDLRTNLVIEKKDSWRFGQLLCKEEYKGTGDNFELLSRTNYTYGYNSPVPAIEIPTWTIYKKKVYKNENEPTFVPSDCYHYCAYPIYTGSKRIVKEEKSEFSGDKITTTRTYNYGNKNHTYPTTITTSYSDGRPAVVKNIKYVQDDTSTSDANHTAARAKLLQNGVKSAVMQEEIIIGGSKQVNKTQYRLYNNNTTPLPWRLTTKRDTNTEEVRTQIHEYDVYGNPLYSTKDDSGHTVYIWSYKGRHPVAVIEGVNYSQVNSALSSIGLGSDYFNVINRKKVPSDSDWQKLAQLRSLFPEGKVSVFKYDESTGDISWTEDARGIKTYYEYDTSGRLVSTYYKEKNAMGVEEKRIIETYKYNLRNL